MDTIEIKKITCPVCNGPVCFEDIHKIEDEERELKEWLCYSCGYTSNSLLVVGSEEVENYEKLSPLLISDLKQLDEERNIYWYPTMLTTTKGCIFPEFSVDGWHWRAAPIAFLTEEDMWRLPEGAKEEVGEPVIALWLSKVFEKNEFYEACKALGSMLKRHKEHEDSINEKSNATKNASGEKE